MDINKHSIELFSVSELLTENTITCPYCWELQQIIVDHTDEETQQLIDCQVCCQPIVLHIQHNSDGLELHTERENQ